MKSLIPVIAVLLLHSVSSSGDQPSSRPYEDTLTTTYSRALSRLSTRKLEERKTLLRSYQRKGYAATLADNLNLDGLMALFSFLKTRLQIEYSVSHEPILIDITAPFDSAGKVQVPEFFSRRKFTVRLPSVPREHSYTSINLDWAFPEDPWRRE